jgi:hypothetical protein
VDALEAVGEAAPEATLQQWLHETQRQLPLTAKQLYPALRDEDIQVPLLLDFAKK